MEQKVWTESSAVFQYFLYVDEMTVTVRPVTQLDRVSGD